MKRILISIGAALMSIGCTSVAKVTLEDRFQAIGIPQGTASCMVDDLDTRLSGQDIQDLARYTIGLSRAGSVFGAIQSLMKIDNPRAVAAVGQSAVGCVTGFGF